MSQRISSLPAILLCLLLPGLAIAADSPTPQQTRVAPGPPLFEFIKTHPDCVSFTDSCVICLRSGDDLNCSTEGIACQPGKPECTSAAPSKK